MAGPPPSLGALAASMLFVGVLAAPPTTASDQSTTGVLVTPVTPGPNTYVDSPKVTEPGQTAVPLGVQLGNRTAVPAIVQVTIGGWCWDSASKKINFSLPPRTVTVPGDPGQVKGNLTMWIESAAVNVPPECKARPNHSAIVPDGAFIADVGPVGSQPEWRKLSNFWIGWTFNATNIRKNLDLRLFKTQPESGAHHTLPQKFRLFFENVPGIYRIDDPQYLVWWCSRAGVPGNHPSMANEYNKLWEDWWAKNPTPTRDQVLKFRDLISKNPKYTYKCP